MADFNLLLPWYLNESLSADEKQAVEDWLVRDETALTAQKFSGRIAAAVTAQESRLPSRQADHKLFALVRKPAPKISGFVQWAWGLPMTLALFLILWLFIQPGTQLQWSAPGSELAAFRIYRAPIGSTSYELITEVSASVQQNHYQYADITLLPAITYQYVIEIIDHEGGSAFSPAVASNTIGTFSAQIAILLTSVMLTFGMITIVQEIISPLQSLKTLTFPK